MVLGIYEGSLELSLAKSKYYPGQAIEGQVKLRMNKPKKARELCVSFYGEMQSDKGDRSKIERVFEVKKQLAGSRTYSNDEKYEFALTIPENCLPKPSGGFYESIISKFSQRANGWFVHATLDIPMEMDLNERVQIQLVPKPAGL